MALSRETELKHIIKGLLSVLYGSAMDYRVDEPVLLSKLVIIESQAEELLAAIQQLVDLTTVDDGE